MITDLEGNGVVVLAGVHGLCDARVGAVCADDEVKFLRLLGAHLGAGAIVLEVDLLCFDASTACVEAGRRQEERRSKSQQRIAVLHIEVDYFSLTKTDLCRSQHDDCHMEIHNLVASDDDRCCRNTHCVET